MGSPQQPTPEQYAQLERAGQLQTLESPRWIDAAGWPRAVSSSTLPAARRLAAPD